MAGRERGSSGARTILGGNFYGYVVGVVLVKMKMPLMFEKMGMNDEDYDE